jgi:hypothetical protein
LHPHFYLLGCSFQQKQTEIFGPDLQENTQKSVSPLTRATATRNETGGRNAGGKYSYHCSTESFPCSVFRDIKTDINATKIKPKFLRNKIQPIPELNLQFCA